jgi:bile acid-coenzyme A ligase
MLIPIADVPRWYAERKPKDTIAISHGADTLSWEQLERGANRRARAFAAKGVKPGDFVAIGLPNSNVFFETTFAVWKCGATPTSLSWRLPHGEAAAVLEILKPALVVGGEADWNAPNSLPANFAPEGFSNEPLANPVPRYWRACALSARTAMTSHRARPARSISCPMTAPAAPIIISAPNRNAGPMAGNRSATSAGSMPTAISISATGSPT